MRKGSKQTEEAKEKIRNSLKNYSMTDEHRRNIGLSHIGNKSKTGQTTSNETRLKQSISHKGEKSSLWKGGVSKENRLIRRSIEFKLWRESVFKRDDYTCKKYRTKGVKLHPHHILNFSEYPELRFSKENGITLSEKAHWEFHQIYGKHNNTKEQLSEFLEK